MKIQNVKQQKWIWIPITIFCFCLIFLRALLLKLGFYAIKKSKKVPLRTVRLYSLVYFCVLVHLDMNFKTYCFLTYGLNILYQINIYKSNVKHNEQISLNNMIKSSQTTTKMEKIYSKIHIVMFESMYKNIDRNSQCFISKTFQ